MIPDFLAAEKLGAGENTLKQYDLYFHSG